MFSMNCLPYYHGKQNSFSRHFLSRKIEWCVLVIQIGFCAMVYWHKRCVLVLPDHSMEKDHDDDVAYIDDDEDADYEEEEDYLFAVFDDCKIFEE